MGLLFIGPPCSLLIWWTQHLSRRRDDRYFVLANNCI